MESFDMNNLNVSRHFEEVEEMIVVIPPINQLECLDYLRRKNPIMSPWELESFLNHFHPGLFRPLDEIIEQELQYIEELAADLRSAFPDRYFTIEHNLGKSKVTFWQTTDISPKDIVRKFGDSHLDNKAWCDNCSNTRSYKIVSYKDPRFPEVDWGKCSECNSLMLAGNYELLTFIGPGLK